MRERIEWMVAVLKGLGVAATSDLTVFLLAVTGLLLGGRRGLGRALLVYVLLNRADQYGHLYASKMDRIALVMGRSTELEQARLELEARRLEHERDST